jgi:LPS export ABC transporter protein LptC
MLLGAIWMFWEHFFPQEPDVQVGYESLDVVVEDLHLIHGGKGQRTWELVAIESRYKRHESRISFDQPRITFYNQKDAEQITARAPSGEYLQDKGLAKLWPQVIATYGQTIVHAKRMVFDQKAQTISFRQDVLIEHPHAQATSDQAMIVLNNNQLVLTGNVEVDLDANSFP